MGVFAPWYLIPSFTPLSILLSLVLVNTLQKEYIFLAKKTLLVICEILFYSVNNYL